MNKTIDTIDEYKELIDLVLSNLKSVGIDIANRQIDHIAYRAKSSEEFDSLKEKLTKGEARFYSEKIIRDRRVCILKFVKPLKYKNFTIHFFEILEPAKGERQFKRQLEHLEVVIDNMNLSGFASKYPNVNFETKNLNNKVNPELILLFPNDANVKFHPMSIDKVVQIEKNKGRKVAIVIFYDNQRNIVFQERGEHSKTGEKYGFFGGGIEEGESPEQALKRELSEELGYILEDLTYWTDNNFKITDDGQYKNWFIECSVYLSKIDDKLFNAKIVEGKSFIKMNIDEAIKNKGFHYGDITLLKKLKNYLE